MSYSDIYLCYKPNKYNKQFKCIKFNSYEDADQYYKENHSGKQSTLFPVYKYMPQFMKNMSIHYKLSKTFIHIDKII